LKDDSIKAIKKSKKDAKEDSKETDHIKESSTSEKDSDRVIKAAGAKD